MQSMCLSHPLKPSFTSNCTESYHVPLFAKSQQNNLLCAAVVWAARLPSYPTLSGLTPASQSKEDHQGNYAAGRTCPGADYF